jgi:hypothetical protein
MALAGPAIIVVLAVVAKVMQVVSVFTANAIPGQLRTALSDAQIYDISTALASSDLSARTAALQELYGAFLPLTLPDYPSTDTVPTAQPGDPQFLDAQVARRAPSNTRPGMARFTRRA